VRLRRQGFTLIELTVVLFLIGLLFLTALPRLGSFLFQGDLGSAARSLKATVHYLRSKSITSHRNTVLFLDLDRGTYWGRYEDVNPDADPGGEAKSFLVSPRQLPENIKILDALNIHSGKRIGGRLRSTFNPKGVFEETVLHLTDTSQRMLTIVISAYTGRFVLYDEYVEVEYGTE
jgi:general secretion pathway protein H